MPAQLVFLTVFLGLVSGKQQIELKAEPSVASIRITLAGQELARLTQAPWRAEVDFGSELVPRELLATGFDANGNEIARASQILNLPGDSAIVDIELERSGAVPETAQLHWRNIEYSSPKSALVTFDERPLRVDSDFRVRFPETDWARPHIISAVMRFNDGMVARREAVIDGVTFSDTTRAEVTPVLLTETSSQHPASYDGCFSIDGAPVRASAVEKEGGYVVFVQDPLPDETIRVLDPARRAINPFSRRELAGWARLDSDTTQEILWPVAQEFTDRSSHAISKLFDHSKEMPASSGLLSLLTASVRTPFVSPRQYADGVAVAGVRSVGGRRHAVVLVLHNAEDGSINDAGPVRRYLSAIGVPLFVWTAAPMPGAAARWGAIDDISSIDHLRSAVDRLRKTLAAQRVAWIQADAFRALRVQTDERCGFAVVH